MAMYDDEYEFDYDRVIEDAEELYEYADYSDEPEYEDDYTNEREYEHYYHNVMDELDNE
jgi:hypothetical protein